MRTPLRPRPRQQSCPQGEEPDSSSRPSACKCSADERLHDPADSFYSRGTPVPGSPGPHVSCFRSKILSINRPANPSPTACTENAEPFSAPAPDSRSPSSPDRRGPGIPGPRQAGLGRHRAFPGAPSTIHDRSGFTGAAQRPYNGRGDPGRHARIRPHGRNRAFFNRPAKD